MGAVRRVKTKRRTRYATVILLESQLPSEIITILKEDYRYRDYDQVRADLTSSKHLALYQATKDPEDLPGLGKHYCVECAKWFESEHNLKAHCKGKNHKRRCVKIPSICFPLAVCSLIEFESFLDGRKLMKYIWAEKIKNLA